MLANSNMSGGRLDGLSAKPRKSVLMIAFHFPPFSGSSGVQRTLRFANYLPENDWAPTVLTASAGAYGELSSDLLGEISTQVQVTRALALDAARHLAIKGRYFRFMALPDRWVSWVAGAVVKGILMIRRSRPDVIWSTYPIASAHVIAWVLKRTMGVPWVADFRDPMVEKDPRTGKYTPSDSMLRKVRLSLERKVVHDADRIVFCTVGARDICAERYPDVAMDKYVVIQNGYDEEAFKLAEGLSVTPGQSDVGTIRLLHSGLLYPTEDRHPKYLFQALRILLERGDLKKGEMEILLRASGYDKQYQAEIDVMGLNEVVRLAPSISYMDALAEMMSVDGLILFQGYTSNPAIPAKYYEYLRARRPVLALVDAEGNTAALAKVTGVGEIVPLDDANQISVGLMRFLGQIRNATAGVASDEEIGRHSRRMRTRELSSLLNGMVTNK